jgi:hypothetical protein
MFDFGLRAMAIYQQWKEVEPSDGATGVNACLVRCPFANKHYGLRTSRGIVTDGKYPGMVAGYNWAEFNLQAARRALRD